MNTQYHSGKLARRNGLTTDACPFGLSELRRRSFWLAGWHDEDMTQKAVINGN